MSSSSLRVLKGVDGMMRELLMECGVMYGFSGEEAIGRLLVKESVSKDVKDKRGRPKKAMKEVSCEKVVDLFAGLVSEVTVATEEVTVPVVEEAVVLMEEKMEKEGFGALMEVVSEGIVKDECDELADLMGGLKVSENKKTEKTEKVKKDKKVEKKVTEEEKALIAAEKEAKKAEEKVKKEAEKEAAKEALKLKKEAEKAEEKLKKEAEKEALKLKKEAEKAQEKNEKKEPKKKKEAQVEEKKEQAQAVVKKEVLKEEKKEVIEVPKITVTRFEFEGKQYLKSSENILYDPKSREELGIWCEESKTIKELPEEEDEDDEEMDEESYEE